MPLHLIRHDITLMKVDAIVNAANNALEPGGGVDGAIHRAAGPGLLAECRALGGCKTGEAKITSAYDLPCRYVIHTVGPIWRGGKLGEEALLASCYHKSLELALKYGCESIAFPLISAGAYGYPKDQAMRVAMDSIRDFLMENDMLVYIVVFDKRSFAIGGKLFADITQFIDDNYVETHVDHNLESRRRFHYSPAPVEEVSHKAHPEPAEKVCFEPASEQEMWGGRIGPVPTADYSLDELLGQIDESFTQMLFRKIDERGISDAACYKRANLSRKLFSKIRSDVHYKPSKRTAIALGIALELPLNEMKDLLMKAGYALSHSNRFDIIIEYFIVRGQYDIFEINETLFYFDQPLLGA